MDEDRIENAYPDQMMAGDLAPRINMDDGEAFNLRAVPGRRAA